MALRLCRFKLLLMSRTPRDSAYMRVAAGGNGEYDADWDEPYAPPPPPKLKRAAQAPKKIATVGATGAPYR